MDQIFLQSLPNQPLWSESTTDFSRSGLFTVLRLPYSVSPQDRQIELFEACFTSECAHCQQHPVLRAAKVFRCRRRIFIKEERTVKIALNQSNDPLPLRAASYPSSRIASPPDQSFHAHYQFNQPVFLVPSARWRVTGRFQKADVSIF
jgi:hypothetical protein